MLSAIRWALPDRLMWPREFGATLKRSPSFVSPFSVLAIVIASIFVTVTDRMWWGSYTDVKAMSLSIAWGVAISVALCLLGATVLNGLLRRRNGVGTFSLTLSSMGYAFLPVTLAAALWLVLVIAMGGGAPIGISMYLREGWWATAALWGTGALWSIWSLIEVSAEVHEIATEDAFWTVLYSAAILTLGVAFIVLALRGYPIPEPPRYD